MQGKVIRSIGLFLVVASSIAAFAPSSAGETALPACSDGAYHLNGTKWKSTLKWSFQASTTPKSLSKDSAQRRLMRAAKTVATGGNRCGLVSHVSAHEQFLGRTSAHPDIRPDGSCGTPDGRNVIGFGSLPVGYMALTCYWSMSGSTVESDILFNKADYHFVARVGPKCTWAWSLRAVATHEFGHAFGLGHVTEGLHAHLTMAPYIMACQTSEARLGLGDLRGMRALY